MILLLSYGIFSIVVVVKNWQCPWCKAFMCLFHYSILANYAWMFVEGLYLHGLVYRALHSSQHKASFGTQATLATWSTYSLAKVTLPTKYMGIYPTQQRRATEKRFFFQHVVSFKCTDVQVPVTKNALTSGASLKSLLTCVTLWHVYDLTARTERHRYNVILEKCLWRQTKYFDPNFAFVCGYCISLYYMLFYDSWLTIEFVTNCSWSAMDHHPMGNSSIKTRQSVVSIKDWNLKD